MNILDEERFRAPSPGFDENFLWQGGDMTRKIA